MAGRYNSTDYMYGSARIRAIEGRIAGKEKLEHMLEAKSSADIISMLPDLGFTIRYEGDDGIGAILREETLLSALKIGYSELDEMSNEAHVTDFLRYQYDCNNIKALIKCFSRGVSADSMLFDGIGTVSIIDAKEAFAKKDYSAYPEHMKEAIPQAEEAFAKTGNPQKVDIIIDRACYADMLNTACATGIYLAERMVRAKIDITNIISCIRLIRMKQGIMTETYLAEVIIDGGYLEADMFEKAVRNGETWLSEKLSFSRYSSLASDIESGNALNIIEKNADDLFMDIAMEAKYVPFGAEVLIGYAIALEYEIRNIRIILAGKDAALSAERIRERLRKSYV